MELGITVIIDEEIDEPSLKRYKGFTRFLFVREGGVREMETDDVTLAISHGGQCLEHFELGAGKVADVFIQLGHDEHWRCSVDDLIVALDWCVCSGVALVSLSMGTTQYCDATKVAAAVQTVQDCGIVFIAGANNEGFLSFPACLPGCVGVKVGSTIDAWAYTPNPYDGTDITLSPDIVNGRRLDSTSMATAYFAGVASKFLPNTLQNWLVEETSCPAPRLLYENTFSTAPDAPADGMLVVAVEGISASNSGLIYGRALQTLFMETEYHCLIVHPSDCAITASDFAGYELLAPDDGVCTYEECVDLAVRICQPSLVLVDFATYLGDIHATISEASHTPSDAYNMLIESFG